MAKETPTDFEDEEDAERYYYLPSDSQCPAPEVHLLGLVVIWFGNLEFSLEMSLCQLLTDQDDRESFDMAQSTAAELFTFQKTMDDFARRFRQKGIASAEPELEKLLEKLKSAGTRRNQLMHSAWSPSSLWGGQDLMRMKALRDKKKVAVRDKEKVRREFERMPAESIEEARRIIEEASQALWLFTVKYIQTPEDETKQTD
jgi:hypothetical protein